MVSAYQDQVCAWFSLVRLPTEAARKLFLYHFPKEMALSFVFWLLEPVCAAFNWVLSVTKKHLRIAGFFASISFLTYTFLYKRLKLSIHCVQL